MRAEVEMPDEIASFTSRLRSRPWLEADWIAVIDQGLRTAVRDPDPSLWRQLHEVICDDEELTVADQLRQISRITAAHLRNERARHAAH
jgi:hypothetical protein